MIKQTITFTADIYSIEDVDINLQFLNTKFEDVVNSINYYDLPLASKPKVLVGSCKTSVLSTKEQ